MRALILVLALLAPQEQPDLLKSCEALYEPLTSLIPETRAKAHADLVKLTAKVALAIRRMRVLMTGLP